MKHKLTKFFFAGVLLFLLLGVSNLMGANRYSVATGNWNSTATWSATSGGASGASVPVAADIVYIEGNRTVTIPNNVTAVCTNVSIASGSTLSLAGATVTVSGTTTVNGSIIHTNTNGTKSYGNVIISGGTWTSNVAETYAMTSLTLSGSTINGSNTGIINVSGNLTVTAATTNTLNAVTFTVTGTSTINGSLVVASTAGNKVFVGQTTISSTGTWDNDNVNEAINFRGGLTNNGTFYAGTSAYTFDTNAQAISGTVAIPNVAVTGITLTNNGALTVATALTGSGGLTQGAAGSLNLGGTSTITTLTASAAGNTVNYTGAAQTVKPAIYYNLTLSGSGAKTTTGVTVNGVLSIEGTATASVAPTYGTAATLQYNTTTARTAGVEWISPFVATGGITIANTGAITLNSAEVFNTSVPLTINSGATLSMSTFLLTLNGNLINNGGTISGTTGGVTIAGTATQSIGAFTTTGTVSITKTAGTATFTGNVNGSGLTINGTGGTLNLGAGLTHTFTGTTTITAGTLNGGSSLLKIGGSVSGTGGTFTAGTGTVEWNAAGAQTVAAVAYNNLVLSGSGAKSIATGTSVTGNLSITGATASIGAGLNISVGTLSLGGLNKVNGTWGSTTSAATNKDNTYFSATTGYVTVTTDTRPTSTISGVTASQSICFGAASVTFTGTVSSGTVYPVNGETVGVTINGSTQNATIAGGAGGFSINFTTPTIPSSVTPYTITYAYAGGVNLKAAANNTSTTLTVNTTPAQPSVITGSTSPCQTSSQTYSVTNVAGVTYTWTFPSGWTQTAGGTTYSVTATVGSGSGNVQVTPSNGCGNGTARTLAVTSISSVGGTLGGGTSPICLGSSTGTMTLTGYTGTIVQWERQVNSGGWTNIYNGGSATLSESPWSSGVWQYRVAVQNGTCSTVYSTVLSITVDPTSVGGYISGSSTPICLGSSTGTLTINGSTGSVVRWERRLNSGTWENIANTLTTYSEVPSSGGTWEYRALLQSGSCPSLYATSFSMTVNPTLTITLGSNPVICRGTTTALLPYSATTGSPSAYSISFDAAAKTAGMSDVSGSGLTASPIQINVPWNIAAGVYNATLSVATTYPVCSSVGYPITVTVTPATAISSQSTATQTQCINGTFTAISVTASGTGTITYQWYKNTTASNTGGTLLTGATSASYTPLATATGTLYYYCIVHSNCGSDITSAVSGAFIVNSGTSISSQSTATQTQCQNATFTAISVTATGTGTITYQWYSNATASTTGGTLLTGATIASYTPLATAAGTLYYYCIVNGTCGSVTSAVSGAFIVNPATAISSQSTATQTQCLNGTFTAISVTATGTGTITYQWYKNTTASNTGGTLLTGATSASYTPLATATGTLYYYCIVHSNCGSDITSAVSGAFVVNTSTSISSQSTATQTQCLNGTFTAISIAATGTGTITYQWYSNTTASNTGGTLLTGATSTSYIPLATASGTLYYYCIVHSNCGSDITSAVSGAFIVNPATAISSQSTATQTQCLNGTFTTISVTATGTGTITYQWYKNTTASNTGGTLLTGATSASYTPLATASGTLYYYCIVHSNCGSDITSVVSGAFIVNTATSISSQSTATQTQCLNGTFTAISVTATGTGTITYQWYSNTTASTTGGTLLTGATNASYTPPATATGTLYYYCIVSGSCGSVTSAVSGAFIVNIGTAISSQSTATQTQCLNGTFTAISVTATGTGAITYQWYSNATASTTGGTLLTGATSASYTPLATAAGTLYYYCIVSGSCGSVTSAVSGAFIVNPATAISSQSTATQTQCLNGTFTAISVTATGTGTITYQWYSNTTASTSGGTLLTGAISASYTPQATATGTLYYYCIVHSNCGSDITSAVSGAFIVTAISNVTVPTAAGGSAAATLSWTNPSSCYDEILIVANAGSSVSGTPSGDGTAYTANLAYGSGTAFTGGGYVVYKSTTSPQTITSLVNGTQYYFKFFTRKGTVWSAGIETNVTLANASLTSDYYRSIASGNWNANATWQSSHDGVNWFNATLTPTSSANSIIIQNTHTVTVTASASADQFTINAGGQLTVNTGQTLTIADGTGTDLTVYGTLVNSGTITNTGTLAFGSGSTYQHAGNGGTIPTATWDATSNCNITGITTTLTLGGLGQTFGNFTWNCTAQATGNVYLESNMTVAGDFTVLSTGATNDPNNFSLRMSNTTTGYTINVLGNFIVSNTASFKMNNNTGGCILNVGGNFSLGGTGNFTIVTGGASSAVNVTGNVSITGGTLIMNENDAVSVGSLNVGGNFTLSNATINTNTSTWPGTINFNGNTTHIYTNTGGTYTNTVNFNVNSPSVLDVGTSIINGSDGTFTLNSGAGIITGHAQGLSTTAATGSIQVTGTKTYNAGANYTYDGTSAQVTGNGLTGANNLNINNATGVTLTSSATVSGLLNLTSGILTTGANAVTLTNNSTSAVTGGSTANFVNGALIWQLAPGQTYLYPIGKGTTFLPFSITGITGTTPGVRVEAFTANTGGTATNPLGSLSTTEYWLASVASGTYTNGSVSLTRQTALAGLNAIGRSATLAGAYATLNGTASGTSIISSDNTGNTLGYFVMANKRSITTSAISGSPFCAGSAVSVPYTIIGTYTAGNIFTAQISDASGSFSTPVTVGTLTSTATGTISGTIPAGTASGSGYRIRVVSSTPIVTGSDNGSDLTVNPLPAAPVASAGSGAACSQITANWAASTYATSYALDVSTVIGFGSYVTGYQNLTVGNVTTYNISTLSPGTTYYYRVRALNGCGTSVSSGTITYATTSIPAQPSLITGSATPCQTSSQTYSVTNVTGISYTWALPAGWVQTGGGTTNSITVTVGSGSGNITVTPSNTCGTGIAQTLAVVPTAVPAATSAITGSGTPCQTSSQTYSVINVAGVTYTWTFPTGWTQTAGGTTYSVTVTVGAGSGFVQVTPSNACGNGIATTLAVTPTTVPVQPSTITGSATPCQTSSQTYSVTNVSGVTYTWTFPTGWTKTAGGTTNSVTVTVGAGSGNVQVTPSNACGNGTAQTLAVVPTAAVPALPSTITGSTTPCQTASQAYSVTNVAGVTYTWTFPTGWVQTAGGTTNSITVTVGTGTGNIQVTPSNSCGNGTARTLAVTPVALPAQPSTITGNATPCLSSSQSYSVTNVSGLTYLWTFPTGWAQTAGGTTNSVTVTVGAGSGNIQVIPSNGGCTNTPRTLAVTPTTVPAQPSTITGNATPCQATSQTYSVTNVANVTYTWTLPSGWTITAGQTTNSVTVTIGAGTGNVQVTPSNTCGNGTAQTLAATPAAAIPGQPSTITGSAAPCQTSSQVYSVTNVAGVTYTWTFPAGWTQTAGGTTNSVTVTVGSGSGNVQVIPSTACGSGTSRTLAVTANVAPSAPTTTGATICIGSTATLSASGAATGDTYKWYDAATAGNLLKTSASNVDNTYTTAVLAATTNFWVSIVNSGGCEGLRTLVTATFPTASPDDSNAAGTNSWIGHVYDGMTFTTYYGTYTENETFNESFGGATTCFALNSSLGARSIYTETFSVHYRMNSTKRGLYIVDLGSDDGSRLTVDGTLLYNNWADQAYIAYPRVLMSLKGTSSLLYDFYDNAGANQAVFQNLTLVLANTLTTGTSQSIYVGGTWSTISGDVYGTLPTGITLSGTGYQWSYSTTPLGTRTTISGATGATYTPSASVAPFNTPGTYYIYRNAVLSSTNNVSPNPYVATNESNAAVLTISSVPAITTSTSTLTGLNYPVGFGPSAEQSFTVSGTNLSANLIITPTANFEISTGTGASFVASNPITLLVSSGNVSATTIYVRLKAGLSIGTVPAENIVCSSTGLTSKNVACSGAVTAIPVITATPNLTGFSYPYTKGPSSQQTFTVSGTNLVANVIVTPSASFEISTTSGANFVSTPITLTPTGGTLAATTIYVRMKSGLGIGGYAENIVSSSTSATSQNISCTGTVVGSNLILLSTSSLAGFIYTSGAGPSASQSFTVSGSLLTNNVVITPATNYAISLTAGGTYQTTALTLTQSGGTLNTTTIYVRLVAGLAVGTYPAINIPVSSTGAITKSVGCSGAVVNTPTIIVSKNTLTGFGYMSSDGGPSGTQSFTVSGASLTANVSLTPPANYEISLTSGGTYQSTALTLTQTGGILAPTTIYARLKSGLTAGNYNGGNIVVTSGGLTQNIACVGIVFVSPLITAGVSPASACAGSTVNLTSVGESTIANRYWQGPNGFYSSLQNPVLTNVTTNMTGTYTVTGNVVVGGNLVTNGNFELGNTSFGTSYALAAQTTNGLWPESTYDVLVNPHSEHPNFARCGDHTTGTGKQMVVNGSGVAGAVIWTQSVPVIPGANYQFTYWVQSVHAESPSQLQLYVNSVAVGPVYIADFDTCSWKQFAYNATAGSGISSMNLELINQNTALSGNDFSLDDIVFQQILPATSSVDLTVNPNLPVSVSLAASPNPTTTGTTVTFTATPTNGGAAPNYQWKVNGTTVSSGSSPTYSSSTLSDGDIVTVVLTSSLTCVTGNPATSNTVIMMVSTRVNYWYGFNSTDWGTASNWTASYIPAAGDDVEFATVANYGSAAIRDLYVDTHRTIGSLIDATTKSTVIPSNKELTVNRGLYLGSSAHINASAQYSTIEFAGTIAQTIPASTFTNDEVYDIIINNSNNVTLNGTMRLLDVITAPAGRLDATTQSPTVVYAGDPYAKQTIEMNRYLNNTMYNLGVYNVFGVWLSTTASIYVPHDCTITRGVLTVPPGATLTVDNYTKLDYRAPLPVYYPLQIDYWSCLVLKSDSVLTGSFVHSDLFSSAIGNGTVKVERYMSHTNNWHLYSSPIKDESIHYFLQYNPEIPDLFDLNPDVLVAAGIRDYNTVTNLWNPYYYYPTSPGTVGSIGLGKGFNIRTIYNYNSIIGTGRVDATGTPNLNTVNVAITRSATPTDYGWNCVGNPFTCALNIRNTSNDGFLNAANISQLDPNYIAVYLWDTNNITTNHITPEYIVINNATTITSIQTAQGFFVKSKTGGGTVNFSKNMQLPNAALSFKAAVVEWPSIKIVAWDQTSSSSTEVKFVANTTKGLDPGYDAGLYIANPDFVIYSKLMEDNAVDYTLQCLPDQDYDQYIIPIGINHKTAGQIKFTAETINLPSGCHAVLEDRLTNTFTRLDLKDASYKATLEADTKGTGRFYLHTYDAIGSSQPVQNQKFKVYSVAKNIYVIGEVSGDARFYLYSVDGKLLANFNAQNQLQNQLDASDYASGVYLLTIIDGNMKKTIKFVLEN